MGQATGSILRPGTGRFAMALSEDAVEMRDIVVAASKHHSGDRMITGLEESGGVLKPQFTQKPAKGFAIGFTKQVREPTAGKPRAGGGPIQVPIIVKGFAYLVPHRFDPITGGGPAAFHG